MIRNARLATPLLLRLMRLLFDVYAVVISPPAPMTLLILLPPPII